MRALRLLFIAAFFALTLLPLAQMTLRLPSVPRVDENRTPAPRPRPIWQDPFEWVKEADAWFTDHFGFRSLLIRTKTQIDYSIFHTSTRVHIGKDNHLFFRSAMDADRPAIEHLLKRNASDIVDNVRLLHSALASRGIRLGLTVNLLPDRFLPEKLPASAPRYTGPRPMDSLIAQFDKQLGPDFFDATSILNEVARKHPVFQKTDFHWNVPSAGEVAKVIVNRWASLLGRATPVWTLDVAMRPRRYSGDIARFMPLFVMPEETTLEIVYNYRNPDGAQPFSNQGIFEAGHRISDPRPDLLPTGVMVGDSYSDGYLVAGFWTYFQNFYRVRWWPGVTISRLIESLPHDTRLILIQFIETDGTALEALADTADIKRAVAMIEKRPSVAADPGSRTAP